MSDAEGYTVSAPDLALLGGGDVREGRKILRLMMADERERKRIDGPTERPKNVRIATQRDEPALLDLILLDLDENAKHIAPISPERVLAHIRTGTRQEGGLVGVIDAPDGRLAGVAMLIPVQWWFSETRYIQDLAIYVHPDYRKTRYSHDLIHFCCWAADEWSRGFGYRIVFMAGVTATKNAKGKMRFYKRMMNQVGALYAYPSVGRD